MGIQSVRVGVFCAICALVAAGRAGAVAIVFDGPGGYGVSAERVDAAEADGLQIIEVDRLFTADELGLSVPTRVVQDFSISPNPSPANPTRANSLWTVTTFGHGNLVDTWLVFFNTSPEYEDALVGFEADDEDGWAVISVFNDETEYFYPAVFLNDLDPSNPVAFTMRHLVGQPLNQNSSGEFVLPRYTVGSLQGVPAPEPSALALGGAGIALLGLLRRRSA